MSNTNLAGKNEVSVEFALGDGEANTKQSNNITQNRGRKAATGPDELVEMRFYIPGTVSKKEKGGESEKGPDGKVKNEDGEEDEEGGEDEDEEEGEEQNAANLFYDTLMDKAEIGDVAGDTFATFLDVLHLTPRYEKTCKDFGEDPSMANLFTKRSFRYRYVRIILSIAWKDVRLQDTVLCDQEVFSAPQK